MAFCTNCGTKAIGDFCTNCGQATPLVQKNKNSPASASNNSFSTPGSEAADQQSFATFQAPASKYPIRGPRPKLKELARDRKPLFFGVVALILFGSLALFPAGGSYKVVFSNDASSNPPVPFELTANGKTSKFTGSSFDGQVLAEGTWNPFQPISVRYIPSPIKDDVIFFQVPVFANLGVWNLGRELKAVVEVDNQSSTIRLEGQLIPLVDFASAGYRSNYAAELQQCKSEFSDIYGGQIDFISKANSNYLRYVKEESLDGIRTLYYTTWAARSDRLQNRISNYTNLINPFFSDSSLDSSSRAVISSLDSLRSAWGNLETVARLEAKSRWSAAWDRIYDAETDLERAANTFVTESAAAAQRDCSRKLDR